MELAKSVTEQYPLVEFYAVSCKAHRDVCSEHTIRGYPTVHAWKANNDTSSILGSSRNSEKAVIEALELDKIVVQEDRKLVDEDEEDAGGDTETDHDGNDTEDDGGNIEEDGDLQEDLEAQHSSKDEDDEEDTDNARPGVGGRVAKASDNDSDENNSEGSADEHETDETGTEEDDADADSNEEDVDAAVNVDSDGDTGTEEETEPVAKHHMVPPANDEDDSDAGDESDSNADVIDFNKMAPPEIDSEDDTEDEPVVDDTADESAADKPDEEDEDQSNGSEEKEDEESNSADDDGESEENESFEEDSDEDRDRNVGAPRGGKDISEAVDAYKAEIKATNGRRPGAGAQKGRSQIRDMDKWKDLIAQKKQEFEKKKNRLHIGGKKTQKGQAGVLVDKAGATNVMKSNTPGTSEYKERMEILLKKINKFRKKRGLPPMTNPVELADKSKMPLKKIVNKPAFREKVPIVKRIFKMTEEEQLILDASLSFMAGLKYGVFMTNDSLTAKEKGALKGWLDLMSVSLPPEWGLHSLIDELNENIESISQSQDNLLKILRKHPLPRRIWSPSCMRRDSPQGFSCGMWKLLHTSTVGIAEQRGGLNLVRSGAVDPGTSIFSPADAADTIREYLAHFFGCIECRNHFIAQYDACSFRRCDRLTDNAGMATAEDWKQLALWLWEVHNDVSVQVGHERIERAMENIKTTRFRMAKLKREDEIKHLFPSIEQCFQCFDEDGSFDEDNVFEYLEQLYWSAPDVMADKLLQYHGEEGPGSGFFLFFVIIVFAAFYIMRGRKVDGFQRTVNAAMVQGRKLGSKKRSA